MTKARYDNISYKQLLKHFIIAYVNNDPLIQEFVMRVNKKKISKPSLKKMIKDKKQEEQVIKDFALDESDIEDIFDEIGKENPDI